MSTCRFNYLAGRKTWRNAACSVTRLELQVFDASSHVRVASGKETLLSQVILATNIAETSLTVPGVRYVVDTGLVKARSFQAQQAIESLQVVPVSQAQARQRSGRAGKPACAHCRLPIPLLFG